MKRLVLIIPILIVLGFQKPKTCIDYPYNDVMKYLQSNTETGYCVMQEYLEKCQGNENINGKDYSKSEYMRLFLENAKSTLDSIDGVGTLVHESIHSLSRRRLFSKDSYYFLDCTKDTVVKHTKSFASKKIIKVIPDSCKTFRYSTYIDSKSRIQSTQTDGIYGLLEEFNAYYHGAHTKYDFKPHINDSLYLPGIVASEMQAYYEFKYYIITYLIYAEKHHSRKFYKIMNNEGFKEVFEYVDTNFAILVDEFITDGNKISWAGKDNVHCLINTLQTPEYQAMLKLIY